MRRVSQFRIATTLLTLALWVGCADPGGPPSNLAGPVTCEATTCASGQLCVRRFGGSDAGTAPPPLRCETPPCTVVANCGSAGEQSCSDVPGNCANPLCGMLGAGRVQGRLVECRGQ